MSRHSCKTAYINVYKHHQNRGYYGEKSRNGVHARASAISALECARKLNSRCREANLPLPNPAVGSHVPEKKTRNVSFIKTRNWFQGEKTENGTYVRCGAKNELECAKILNYKCREAKISIPNPSVGFQKPKTRIPVDVGFNNVRLVGDRYYGSKCGNNRKVQCSAKTALECAKVLNFKCKEAGMSVPNVGAGFQKPKYVVAKDKSGYFNISCDGKYYCGQKVFRGKCIRSKSKTALECAKMLNYNCRSVGCPLPNPSAGFQEPKAMKKKVSKKKRGARKYEKKIRLTEY